MIKITDKELARQNLSECAKKSLTNNHIDVIDGKIIFKATDILRAMGIDIIG